MNSFLEPNSLTGYNAAVIALFLNWILLPNISRHQHPVVWIAYVGPYFEAYEYNQQAYILYAGRQSYISFASTCL